jgi:hypothetical protein
LWEEDHAKNDQNSDPVQGNAQGASFLALTAPNIQLNEADWCNAEQFPPRRFAPEEKFSIVDLELVYLASLI